MTQSNQQIETCKNILSSAVLDSQGISHPHLFEASGRSITLPKSVKQNTDNDLIGSIHKYRSNSKRRRQMLNQKNDGQDISEQKNDTQVEQQLVRSTSIKSSVLSLLKWIFKLNIVLIIVLAIYFLWTSSSQQQVLQKQVVNLQTQLDSSKKAYQNQLKISKDLQKINKKRLQLKQSEIDQLEEGYKENIKRVKERYYGLENQHSNNKDKYIKLTQQNKNHLQTIEKYESERKNNEEKYKTDVKQLQTKLDDLLTTIKKSQLEYKSTLDSKHSEIQSHKQIIREKQITLAQIEQSKRQFLSKEVELKELTKQFQKKDEELKEKQFYAKKLMDQLANETMHHSYRVRSSFREQTPGIAGKEKFQPKDGYDFKVQVDKIVKSAVQRVYDEKGLKEWSGIKKRQFQRAIRLMEVVHNVNYYGQFIFDHYNFYNSVQDKYETLKKLLTDQKQYYDSRYHIKEYARNQIGICVFVNAEGNPNSRLYLRNLDSIFQQDYKNYHVVYVNDGVVKLKQYLVGYMKVNEIPDDKYVLINNQHNKGFAENLYVYANKYCHYGEIIAIIDGDDSFIGRQAFSLLNAVYQKQKVAIVYTQHLNVRESIVSEGDSLPIPAKTLSSGNIRSRKKMFTKTLQTMYVDVFKLINAQYLKDNQGKFLQASVDVAFMTSAIQLAGIRVQFLQELIYEYSYGEAGTMAQRSEAEKIIFQKRPFDTLLDFDFADNPLTISYD